MADVIVENLTRTFGKTMALDGVSFHVRSGEFLTLLGPSGCGKSTTLNALAGLDRPTSGAIRIGDTTVYDSLSGTFVDAQYRRLGLMFQSYALWPHMSVFKNLDFALELNGIRGKAARDRIRETLELVDMAEYADRFPGELSGGQQQRVALARTMVYRPKILLLDEPLSNLDAKLREKARLWLADIQRKSGITTIFVTHDQSEALSLSDRVIVMENGRISQIGTPRDVYMNPANPFVADFVGASNIFEAEFVAPESGGGRYRLPDGNQFLGPLPAQSAPGAQVTVSIRPESVRLTDTAASGALPCEIVARSYLGSTSLLVVKIGQLSLRVEAPANTPDEGRYVEFPEDAVRAFG
ncbi:ABC transporter ATP-binding protein [Pseudooceanicola onchidii]|uniref:ABC transporter ATP-binding protein n=1 Tax=Pseudooceanicola onchidii TaxID=2562279 RepID=UPI0010AB3FF1|nr:ABC transporter ATP-binding protein [Pseudooceanicola onchidii]